MISFKFDFHMLQRL